MSLEIPKIPIPGQVTPEFNCVTLEELKMIDKDGDYIDYIETRGNPVMLNYIDQHSKEISEKEDDDIEFIFKKYREQSSSLSKRDICILEEEFSKISYDDILFLESTIAKKNEEIKEMEKEIKNEMR